MRYDISNQKAPEMPNLGKGTECIKFLLTQASKDMHEPLVPMLFPSLGAHISGAEFQYPDRSWKETCGMMAQLVGNSGDNKGQLTDLVKAICRDFTRHDEAEYKKLEDWSNLYQAKKNAKDTPVCPTIAIWFPPADTTKPAFLENAIVLEEQGGRTQYFDLPEVEMETLRVQMGKSKEGTGSQLRKWVFRKFITFSNQTGLYTKTDEYLNNA